MTLHYLFDKLLRVCTCRPPSLYMDQLQRSASHTPSLSQANPPLSILMHANSTDSKHAHVPSSSRRPAAGAQPLVQVPPCVHERSPHHPILADKTGSYHPVPFPHPRCISKPHNILQTRSRTLLVVIARNEPQVPEWERLGQNKQ